METAVRLIPPWLAALAACGTLAAVAACSSADPSPMAQNGAAHPAVPCSRFAAQLAWLEHYTRHADSIAMSTVNPYPQMHALSDMFANVSNGSGATLAVDEVNYESDFGWLSPGEGGSQLTAVLHDIGVLSAVC